MIAVSHVRAVSMLRWHSWIVHVLIARKWTCRHCGHDSFREVPSVVTQPGSSSQHRAGRLTLWETLGLQWELFHQASLPLLQCAVELPDDGASPQRGTNVSFGSLDEDQLSIAASECGLLSPGEEDEAELHPSGVVKSQQSTSRTHTSTSRFCLDWVVPVSWYLYQSRVGCPCSAKESGHSHFQLPRWQFFFLSMI